MSFKLDFCTDSDMPRAFEIVSLAFGHEHAYLEGVFPDHDTPKGRAEGAERLLFAKQNLPNSFFYKAVDTSTGEMIGFAKWDIYDGFIPPDFVTLPGDYWKDADAKAWADHLFYEFTRRRWDAVKESGGRIVSLDLMIVDPAHHRRGVGALLMTPGIEAADRMGVETVVEASRMGRYLYEPYGFVILEDVLIKNPPKQADEQEQFFHWMRRPVKAA